MGKKRTKSVEYTRIKGGDGGSKSFVMLYESLLKNPNFQQLDISLQKFYIACLSQWQSAEGRACLYRHREETQTQYSLYCFCFPSRHLQQYGYDRSNGSKYLGDLIALGLIRKVEDNKIRKKINVYEFLDGWSTLPEKWEALKQARARKKASSK